MFSFFAFHFLTHQNLISFNPFLKLTFIFIFEGIKFLQFPRNLTKLAEHKDKYLKKDCLL